MARVVETLGTRTGGPPTGGPLGLLALAWAAPLLFPLVGCGPGPGTAEVLRLEGVRPEQSEGVFLNEQLVFHFSEALDPASVTSASVRILPTDPELAARFGPARGELVVAGRALVFTPAPVLAFDLQDGGYRPGTSYSVELAGFPRPEGLRAKSGAPLASSARYDFSTVEVGEDRVAIAFEDPAPGRGLPVFLRSDSVEPGEPILLEGGEPLDPSTLYAADFTLRKGPRVRSELGPPIPLRARLRDNRDRTSGAGATVIELLPTQRLEIGETYQLLVDERMLRLRDFGGHRVIVRNAQGRTRLELTVRPPLSGLAEAYLEYTETFIDDRLRSPEPVPGVDGTIHWTDTGRAQVRWPRSAGSGRDGALELGERHFADDTEATSVRSQERVTTRLNAVPGLVVLRSQGKLLVAGRVERRTGEPFTSTTALPFVLEEVELPDSARPVSPGAAAGEGLSDWLLRARAVNANWTVLIAGGDLVIEGTVSSDGPLMLVAGGEVRVATGARIEAPFVATVGHRPRAEVRYFDGQRPADAWRADLVIEAPESNPLAAPLRLGVRSAPIPQIGEAARWHPGPRVGGRAGSGAWRLSYIGSPQAPPRAPRFGPGSGPTGTASNGDSSRTEQVADDPAMLEASPTLRFELVFELPAASDEGSWDPPWIDSIQLRWDPVVGRFQGGGR